MGSQPTPWAPPPHHVNSRQGLITCAVEEPFDASVDWRINQPGQKSWIRVTLSGAIQAWHLRHTGVRVGSYDKPFIPKGAYYSADQRQAMGLSAA